MENRVNLESRIKKYNRIGKMFAVMLEIFLIEKQNHFRNRITGKHALTNVYQIAWKVVLNKICATYNTNMV